MIQLDSKPLMHQSWRDIAFIHWRIPIPVAQRLLPAGLEVDTFEGETYVGLVPFTMHSIRLDGFPAVPWLSAFHETNVRLYVRGPNGAPGVHFLSLDAERLPAVLTAQSAYGLPYKWSRMILEKTGERVHYWTNRIWPGMSAQSKIILAPTGDLAVSEPGTLSHFLVERYHLFVSHRREIYSTTVSHAPYQIQPCQLFELSDGLVYRAGIRVEGAPLSVLYSPGTNVSVSRHVCVSEPIE